jgi:hypothetical protein
MRRHLSFSGLEGSQRGAATLPVGVLLLFIAALVLIAVSRTTLMEQRISGNEIRVRQALQAAQAGISHAMAYMQAEGIDRVSPTDQADAITSLTLPTGASYQVYFCDPSPAPQPDPYPPVDACVTPASRSTCGSGFNEKAKFGLPLVLACGRSDDGIALQPVVVSFARAITLADAPANPVISKGTINVQGGATVTNYFTNLTIRTGEPLASLGHSGKTFVRNPAVPEPSMSATPPERPTSCTVTTDYVCLTDKSVAGPDVFDRDLTLKNLPDAAMFNNMFGADFITYRDDIATRSITAAEVDVLEGETVSGEAVVITGSSADVDLPGGVIGSRDHPVILIMEGNWEQGATTTVYGIVYVRGDMDVRGTVTVYGHVSVEGSVGGTGSLDVIYDPYAIEGGKRLGKPGMLAGSWRDWL